MLQWAPRFEGLDVWLKGLALRISRMFPISLQPNWADRQQNRACLCLVNFASPEICICSHSARPLLLPIQFSSCARLRKQQWWLERRGQINQRPTPNYCCPNSYTPTMTEPWEWSIDQRGDFFFLLFPLSSSLPLITTPVDTDGHSQSSRSNPLDGTQWVSHEPSCGRRLP